jgi:hypothetical protein
MLLAGVVICVVVLYLWLACAFGRLLHRLDRW